MCDHSTRSVRDGDCGQLLHRRVTGISETSSLPSAMEIFTEISCRFERRGNVDLGRKVIMSASESFVRLGPSTNPVHPALLGDITRSGSNHTFKISHIHLSPVGRTICDHNASSFYKAIRVAQPPILALSPFHFSLLPFHVLVFI